MKNLLQSVIVAFSMYSKIPMPKLDWNEKNMKYCMCFFPLIGTVIGALEYGWFRLALQCGWGAGFRTAVLILIPLIVTGGIHMDGLLDTADALSSWKSMEEKLEILKDSHTGAFAIIVGIGYWVLNYGVFSEAVMADMILIGGIHMLSRAYSGFGVVTLKKAKKTGLVATFAQQAADRNVRITMVIYIILVSAAMIAYAPVKGALAALLCLLVFVYYRHLSYSKFGGVTGDLAGFFLQVCELIAAMGVILL